MGASVATALPAAPGANDRKGYLMSYVFPPPPVTSVPVLGTEARFPVHRIYCVGRNYEEHAQEMGFTGREPPFFFMKPADALVPAAGEASALLPYPSLTQNLHHEIELVVAIGKGGRDIAAADAHQHIFGYAVGLDMTRRDHQANALAKGLPWEVTKGFDHSAPVGPITRASDCGILTSGHVKLAVNGQVKQDADISLMIWKVDEIIAKLSEQHRLMAGDIIMTGTPAGVGAVVTGDVLECSVDGLQPMQVRIGGKAA